jgi:hypothetical protein
MNTALEIFMGVITAFIIHTLLIKPYIQNITDDNYTDSTVDGDTGDSPKTPIS